MRFFAAIFAMALLFSTASPSFTFLYSMNGTNPGDSGDFYHFLQPTGLVYADGKLFVADSGKNGLYVMNGSLRQKAIMGSGGGAGLSNPLRMAYENGTLYIADGLSARIKVYLDDGTPIDNWNSGTNMEKPSGVALSPSHMYITDAGKGMLFSYSRQSKAYSRTLLSKGASDGQLEIPSDIEIFNNVVFVSDAGKKLVYVYDSNFTFKYAIGRAGDLMLASPRGIKVYGNRLYVADTNAARVVVYTLDGYPVEVLNASTLGGNFSYPEDIAIGEGKLYVADTGNRLVKVFSINATSGNESVLALITNAERSLGSLRSLEAVADRVDLGYSEGTAAHDISEARAYYDRYVFSTAANLAQKAEDEISSNSANLSFNLGVRIKHLAKDAQDSISPYKTGAKGEVEARILQFDNRVADVNAKVNAKMYSAAADAALALPAYAAEIANLSKTTAEKGEQHALNLTAGLFYLQANSLSGKIAEVRVKAALYRQPADLSGAEELLAAAKDYAARGEFDAANRSLSLAALQVNSYEISVNAASDSVELWRGDLTILEMAFNLTAAKPTLVPADLTLERAQMALAKETLYTNGELAAGMARQAGASAEKKMAEAQALSTAAAALLLMFGMVALIAAAFYLHLRARKRRESGQRDLGEAARKGLRE